MKNDGNYYTQEKGPKEKGHKEIKPYKVNLNPEKDKEGNYI
jgi:hypothetical protein